jgi:hypothetical protein
MTSSAATDLYRALVPACVRRQLMITNGGADGGDDNGSEHDEKDEFNE